MANAKKCDRCGNFYDPYRGIRTKINGTLYSVFIVSLANSFTRINFDICPACMKETIKFLGLEDEGDKNE